MSSFRYEPEIVCGVGLCAQGLEAQLLGTVVREERPDLEEQKDNLVISIASGRKQLQELEDEILRSNIPFSHSQQDHSVVNVCSHCLQEFSLARSEG